MRHTSWHILDTGSTWLKEFAFALGQEVQTCNWSPQMRTLGYWESWQKIEEYPDPKITIIQFPLQRGYARFGIADLMPFQNAVVKRLKAQSVNASESPLICTTPFYAPVAERWPGPVVYYQTDLTKKYAGMNEHQVIALDRRMCRVAAVVCPNSTRIASYLIEEAHCDPKKVTVIPNATRERNVLDHVSTEPGPAPADLADLKRPIIGVIGNLAANMDWLLISDAIRQTKDTSWAFVGPTDMPITDTEQQQARIFVENLGGRVWFLGRKNYGELIHYARAFDVAFLPYLKKEPTYSGSATRFYEHLAACRPILASRGFHELLTKEPLLKLIDDGTDVASAIEDLRSVGFRDGLEESRWRASKEGTWRVRACDLISATFKALGINESSVQDNQSRHSFIDD